MHFCKTFEPNAKESNQNCKILKCILPSVVVVFYENVQVVYKCYNLKVKKYIFIKGIFIYIYF